jgi:hypothetical protein
MIGTILPVFARSMAKKTWERIVGRSNIWSTESAQKTNLEYFDYYDAVHSLLVFINNQFGFDIVL